jgi:N-acetyl-anhydromuramyl-L-alanine amidase AmpD
MENGLAYHFLIGNGKGMGDGEIFVGNRWAKQIQGGHVKGSALNMKSLGIALVGDFESKKPSARQLRSLDFLTEYLAERCRIKKRSIFPHQRFYQQQTKCPGKNFPIKTFLKNLNL